MITHPSSVLRRWFYADSLDRFRSTSPETILGELAQHAGGDIGLDQKNAWQQQIEILKNIDFPADIKGVPKVYFEYTVPRLGRRVDVILLIQHVLFVLEFKVGEKNFSNAALDQAWDYALDLKHFHDASHTICIAPVLIATHASSQPIEVQGTPHDDGLIRPIKANAKNIAQAIEDTLAFFVAPPIDISQWERGRYLPTPSIVEAARALYSGHAVENISRSDAGATNLIVTAREIDRIIQQAKAEHRKAICFVTGVPGAGKTLVGLDVANRHMDKSSATYSVFLSGNGPLVNVLREALARDTVERAREMGDKIRKSDAQKRIEAFIQNVHHFRDDCLRDPAPPPEHVVLFDEAQRAWTLEQTTSFMARKKGRPNFDQSEPEFLISCLDRHKDWAVVVCLVGGGQEINTGEAGIGEWLQAVLNRFASWDVHLPPQLNASEYGSSEMLRRVLARPETTPNSALHLATSMRSFRAESLSKFVREVLGLEADAARSTFRALRDRYPIRISRDLTRAKQWLRNQARGSERYGIVVSSQAQRLKPHAIDVRVKTDPVRWFLDGKDDVRSSYYLEDVATEFQVQGLELDWACVVWDGDLRHDGSVWSHHEFKGSRWQRIKKKERQSYLKNAYRVLMTRARQGMVLVIPEGSDDDPTRDPGYYDNTFSYLSGLGIPSL